MSRRLDVLLAVKALIATALPLAEVVGLGDEEAEAENAGPNGRVVVHAGAPGDPEIDLSPLAYNWTHRIPVEVIFPDEAKLDAALVAIGTAIIADRQLGGLCDWLDAEAPETSDIYEEGTRALRGAPLSLIANYQTPSPLT